MKYRCHEDGVGCHSRYLLTEIRFDYPGPAKSPPVNVYAADSVLGLFRDGLPPTRGGIVFACANHLEHGRAWVQRIRDPAVVVVETAVVPCGACGGVGKGQHVPEPTHMGVRASDGARWSVNECSTCMGRACRPDAKEE